MKRFAPMAALFGVALAIGFSPVAAQEEAADPYVRESYWQVHFAELDAWVSTYTEYVVPVLTGMQEAGTITGFSAAQHNSGGKYNFRFVLIVPDWGTRGSHLAAHRPLSEGGSAAQRAPLHRQVQRQPIGARHVERLLR
jgi:hypothetical protein